ncbi:MAG TPA: DNA-binding response regulator, partial [Chloroflexota bacterium]
ISTAMAVRTIAPRSAVVILTLHDDPATRFHVQAAGVKAFVSKHEAAEALTPAIRGAAGTDEN